MSEPRLLLLETSGQPGWVALGEGDRLRGVHQLDVARHHARDLAPAVARLLAANSWQPRELDAVVVGRGPGSYTGLRVGIMSAKAFAYATGCALIGLDTFATIAAGVPVAFERLAVIADAQQEKVYAQTFIPSGGDWVPASELAIVEVTHWIAELLDTNVFVTGPGLDRWEEILPSIISRSQRGDRQTTPEEVLHQGLMRFTAGKRDDIFSLEPLYLRPSSAEEQWQARRDRVGG